MGLFARTPPEEQVPSPGRGQLLRAMLGGLLIMLLTSAAVATAALLQVNDLVEKINPTGDDISDEAITRAEAGDPQTFLILGSDRRFSDLKKNNPGLRENAPARSDTMMLVRLDPDAEATSVLSLPRDLKVRIPGFGTDKLNAAYSIGGPTLTVKTIKEFTGLDINHVVNINFGGFKDVVNAIGCVYIDVDRRYFNDNNPPNGSPTNYATIDIQPGYQKLCGTDALDYVRYRHFDSDIVRAARQQAFLRQAKDQLNASSLIDKRTKLIDIFGRNTQTDKSLKSDTSVLSVLKLALFSAGNPVRQIQFPATYDDVYVVAKRDDVRETVKEFLNPSREVKEKEVQLTPDSSKKKPKRKPKRSTSPAEVPGLVNGKRMGEDLLAPTVAKSRLGFKIFFPKYVTTNSRYADPGVRTYKVATRAAKFRKAYRLVLSHNVVEGQYWGVQGTNWTTPPILQGPHEIVERHGRKLGVYKDGQRIHVVSWRHDGAVYWVTNTLSDALTNTQMLEIASTLTNDFG